MHGPSIAGAIVALGRQIEAALAGGHSTAALRRRLSELEQQERARAAEAAAAERQARAEAEARDAEEIAAKADALASEVRARIAARLAPLALPAETPRVRRYPDGTTEIATEDWR